MLSVESRTQYETNCSLIQTAALLNLHLQNVLHFYFPLRSRSDNFLVFEIWSFVRDQAVSLCVFLKLNGAYQPFIFDA